MLDNSVVIHMTEENRKEKRGDLTVTKKERKAVGHPCSGRYLDDPAKWKTKMFWGLPLLALSCSLNCGMALWASSLLFSSLFFFLSLDRTSSNPNSFFLLLVLWNLLSEAKARSTRSHAKRTKKTTHLPAVPS
jgi:hypothetical protein